MAFLGDRDPVGMKVYAPAGEETFDYILTTEAAQAGAVRRDAACCRRDADRWRAPGGSTAGRGDQRGDVLARWRAQYGGIKSEEAKRLKVLKDENR